jgi:uncharacterized protein (TIGR02594 family)
VAYKVQSGDTLGRIAQSSGASLDQILALNPEITNPNLIRVGQNILLPDTPQDEVVSLESEFDKPAPTEPRSLDDVVSPMEEEPSMTDSVFGTLGDIGSGLVNMFIPKAYGDTTDKIPEDVQLRAGEPPSVEAIADITTAKNPADMAIKYLGIDENKSEGAEAVRGFFDNIGLEGYKKDLTPDQFAQNTSWCAAFVAQVLRDSGIDTMKALGGTDPYAQVRAASYAKAGTGVPINEVKAGDVMVKYHDEETRKKYNTGIAHVGIVAKVEDGEVYYIGGNTGDKVELSSYKLDDNQFDFRRVTGKEDIPPESLPSLLQLRAGKVGRQIVDRVSNFFSNVIS